MLRDASTFDGSGLQVVHFVSGNTHYAIDIHRVVEVLNPIEPVPVPSGPDFVEGLVELRGRFYPLIDLRRRFGAVAGAIGKIVIVSLDRGRVGLAVDSVVEVARISTDELTPPPILPAAAGDGPINAVVKRGDDVIFVLELGRLLSGDELSSLPQLEHCG